MEHKEEKKKRLPLAAEIFIALLLGILAGLALQSRADLAETYIRPFGTIFLNLLKFIVVPIVLFSIIDGVISMSDIRKVGVIGLQTVVYYLCTTAFAIVIGLTGGSFFSRFFPVLETSGLSFQETERVPPMETLVNMFPSNIIQPMSEAIMLQVIVMAILIGFAIILAGEEAAPAARGIHSFGVVFMKCMDIILRLSPAGVFCLICPVVASNGASILGSLAMVLLAAYVCYLVHILVVYSAAVSLLGGMRPLDFLKGQLPAMIFAFSSASSVGTLPVNMKGCEKMGADQEITSFVLPLGATINMDGTAIYQGVCAIFIAACYGVHLTPGQMVTIVLTATLASIGTAGVPGAGVVMLAMVLQSVGLPVEGIALVAGVDRIFDMGRTVVNITGDASCAVVVSHQERRREQRRPGR